MANTEQKENTAPNTVYLTPSVSLTPLPRHPVSDNTDLDIRMDTMNDSGNKETSRTKSKTSADAEFKSEDGSYDATCTNATTPIDINIMAAAAATAIAAARQASAMNGGEIGEIPLPQISDMLFEFCQTNSILAHLISKSINRAENEVVNSQMHPRNFSITSQPHKQTSLAQSLQPNNRHESREIELAPATFNLPEGTSISLSSTKSVVSTPHIQASIDDTNDVKPLIDPRTGAVLPHTSSISASIFNSNIINGVNKFTTITPRTSPYSEINTGNSSSSHNLPNGHITPLSDDLIGAKATALANAYLSDGVAGESETTNSRKHRTATATITSGALEACLHNSQQETTTSRDCAVVLEDTLNDNSSEAVRDMRIMRQAEILKNIFIAAAKAYNSATRESNTTAEALNTASTPHEMECHQMDELASISTDNRTTESRSNDTNDTRPTHDCPDCGKTYRWKSTLTRHMNVECGNKEPMHECPYCSHKSKQRGNLSVHMRKHHPHLPQLPGIRRSKYHSQ